MAPNPLRRRSALDSTNTKSSFPRNLPDRQRSSPAVLARLRSSLSNRSIGTTTDNVSNVTTESTELLGQVIASDDSDEATTPSLEGIATTNKRRIGVLSMIIVMGVLVVVVSARSLMGDRTTNLVSDQRVEDKAIAASLQLDLNQNEEDESSPNRSSTDESFRDGEEKDNEEEDDDDEDSPCDIIEEEEDNEEDGEDNDEDPPRDINLLPRQPNESSLLIAQQFNNDPHAHRSKMEMILTGELGLVAIRYSPTSFAKLVSIDGSDNGGNGNGNGDGYTNVYADFCVFNPYLNKEDPSYYPTIKDAMAESSHCSEHRYTLPLNEVMSAIKNANVNNGKNGSSNSNNNKTGAMRTTTTTTTKVRTLPLTGLLFHQGHAGSGLLANILSYAYDSTHVISKHPALRDALSACDVIRNRYRSEDNCSEDKRRRLIRDVIALLSRTSDDGSGAKGDTTGRVEHLFLRLDGASTAYLPDLRSMYPNVKWTFSYRNAEETLSKTMHRHHESHNNNSSSSISSAVVSPPPPCAKSKRNPTTNLQQKSQQHNVELEGLNHYQVCALQLSTLLDVALEEHEQSGGGSSGLLVSYEDVVKTSGRVFVDEVLPHFGLTQGDKLRNKRKYSINDGNNDKDFNMDRVAEMLSTKSNSRGKGKERGWDKSMEEDIVILEEVRDAVKLFMGGLMGESN
mmetsp:Transcript_28903/g.62297  ORF Transcript_28903/g.62297 Transcript_28903/m.62297 type:complete len:681 (-) Transcript_28903:62-2104(-)